MCQELSCTLCENHCTLSALGCPKGQRFYEMTEEAYCTLCENHCLLRALQCAKGRAFYQTTDAQTAEQEVFAGPIGLMMRFEIVSHQFGKVRGGQASHLRVIRFLHNHGSVSQGELQLILGIKAATMSEMINRLEEQGLVTRAMSKVDKRIRVLSLTEKGEARYIEQMEREEKLNLFSALSSEEKEQLETLLGKLSYDWRRRDQQTDEDGAASMDVPGACVERAPQNEDAPDEPEAK